MVKASIKSLLARKARLLMSAMAIVLGTAFVAGSLIFTDTLGRTFDGIMDGTVGDVVVQAEQTDQYGGSGGARITAAQVEELADLPGAARADGSVDEFDQTIVMVTHDPVAASHTDRVLFLADGRIVDELWQPERESVLERMVALSNGAH